MQIVTLVVAQPQSPVRWESLAAMTALGKMLASPSRAASPSMQPSAVSLSLRHKAIECALCSCQACVASWLPTVADPSMWRQETPSSHRLLPVTRWELEPPVTTLSTFLQHLATNMNRKELSTAQ